VGGYPLGRFLSDQYLIAITNGFAVERLADPGGVPADLYPRALDLLLA
jgi:hypothetical protein